MLICFDVGNTQVYGGFYDNNKFIHSFRINTKANWSEDQLGIFVKSFCHDKSIDDAKVDRIAVSSVVPSLDYHLENACKKYFNISPLFVKAGIKIGLSVARYKATSEIGADLICGAVGAVEQQPDRNLLIVDMGTATTIIAVNKNKEFLTGLIFAGIKTQMDSLAINAAKLFSVELVKATSITPKSTTESIQAGIYYSQLGGIKFILARLARETFGDESCVVTATGGYAHLFADAFDLVDDDLVLRGLVKIVELNPSL